MVTGPLPWILFNICILTLLALDLFVINRRTRVVSTAEALKWSAFWISLALLFNIWIYLYAGTEPALNFLTGYLIEESLSIDNLFVFLMLFNYFHTPRHLLHKVLFWGILGAIIMRALFIAAGLTLIHLFSPITYLFGLFLIIMGIKMGLKDEKEEINPQKNPVLKLIRKVLPITHDYIDAHFFVRIQGGLWATPLFVTLTAIETSDLIFAFDSIPAILAITQDPFIVYTSNIFAILGLRSLFFALVNLMPLFHYLHYALSFILTFIGFKMLAASFLTIPTAMTLAITLVTLLIAVIASILFPKRS